MCQMFSQSFSLWSSKQSRWVLPHLSSEKVKNIRPNPYDWSEQSQNLNSILLHPQSVGLPLYHRSSRVSSQSCFGSSWNLPIVFSGDLYTRMTLGDDRRINEPFRITVYQGLSLIDAKLWTVFFSHWVAWWQTGVFFLTHVLFWVFKAWCDDED